MQSSDGGGEAYKWRSSYGAYSAVNTYGYQAPEVLFALPTAQKPAPSPAGSPSSTPKTNVPITDWNARHQAVQDLAEDTRELRIVKRRAFATLYNEFLAVVEGAGKKIIEEINLSVTLKTLQPVAAGGVAGGEKFIVDNVFFKLAFDSARLYGGDQFAAKAAGHELKGLNALLKCKPKGIHLPLVALLDYRGYRLFASSILPIDHGTIQYGSDNAGVRVVADPTIHELMRAIGVKLHLKEHLVGVGEAAKALIGPADIEVHNGHDGRFYIVDTARLFPPCMLGSTVQCVFVPAELRDAPSSASAAPPPAPTTPKGGDVALSHYLYPAEEHALPKKTWKADAYALLHVKQEDAIVEQIDEYTVISCRNAVHVNDRASLLLGRAVRGDVLLFRRLVGRHLYELMRTEFLSAFPQPLSSDAFSSFKLPNGPAEMQEVIAATEHLAQVKVPEVARLLDGKQLLPVNASDLKTILHERGINLRFLGLLRSHCKDIYVRNFLLTAMLSRIINQQLLKKLRKVRDSAKAEYIDVAIAYFNVVLGCSASADAYWLTELKIHLTETYSQSSISPNERLPHYDFRFVLQKRPLFQMMQATSALVLAPALLHALHTRPVFFERPKPFSTGDVVDLSAHIKRLDYDSAFDERDGAAGGDFQDLQARGKYLEDVHGKVSLPLACNMLQRLRFHIKEKDLKAALAVSAEVKGVLVAMQQIPIELLVMYLFFSGELLELQKDNGASFACYRNAHSLIISAYGGSFGHPFSLVIANKCAVLAQACKAFNLASQYCEYVSTVWPWAPFPTKDVALKKVVFDDEELIALYEGLKLSPDIDPPLATQEWLRQADLIDTAQRSPALFVPSTLLLGDLSRDLHSSAETLDIQRPAQPPPALPALPAGRLYACGQGKNGSLAFCGFPDRLAPYAPLVDVKIRSVACGDGFFLAASDGKVYSWGSGRYFRLGHGDTDDQRAPKLVQALAAEDIRHVAAGDCHSVAVSVKGEAFLWGLGTGGQLGCGRIADSLKAPTLAPQLTSQFVISAAAGGSHTLLLTSVGEVWSAGNGRSGALGQGSFYEVLHQFCRIETLRGTFVTAIAASDKASFVVTKQGAVLSFGAGGHGELGRSLPETLRAVRSRPSTLHSSKEIATTFIDSVPRPVQLPLPAMRIWCGEQHMFAQLTDESLWGWGGNLRRQVVPGNSDRVFLPERCLPRDSVLAVAAGTSHTLCAVQPQRSRSASLSNSTSTQPPASLANSLVSSAAAIAPLVQQPSALTSSAQAPSSIASSSSSISSSGTHPVPSGALASAATISTPPAVPPPPPRLSASGSSLGSSQELVDGREVAVQVLAWGGAAWGALGGGENVHAAPYPLPVLSFSSPASVVCAAATSGVSLLVATGEPIGN